MEPRLKRKDITKNITGPDNWRGGGAVEGGWGLKGLVIRDPVEREVGGGLRMVSSQKSQQELHPMTKIRSDE